MGVGPFGTMNRLRLKTHSAAPLIQLPRLFTLLGRTGTWITLIGDGWIFLVSHSKTFVGGAGTLDELFETIILIQTRKITRAFVIMGTDYWHEILGLIEQMAKAGMIAPADVELVHATIPDRIPISIKY